MNIKRSIAGVAVVVAMGFGIAACGGASTTAPAPAKPAVTAPAPTAPAPVTTSPPTTVAPTPAPTAPTDNPNPQGYLDVVNSFGGDFNNVSDADLLTLGNAICSDLESGTTVDQEVVSLLSSNQSVFTSGELGEVMGAAAAHLCQSQIPAVQAFSNANG